MKKLLLWICLAVFLFLCVCTMWFLQLFTEADMSAQYIDWQSSVKLMQTIQRPNRIIPNHRKKATDFVLKQSSLQMMNTAI